MALGADTFTEMVTSTLEKIYPTLVDNVYTRHPALNWIRSKETSATGDFLRIPLELAENTSTGYTDSSGSFDTGVSPDIMGSAKYDWSDPLVSKVRLRWLDLQKNDGEQQLVDLIRAHINSMTKAHSQHIAQDLHAGTDLRTPTERFLSLAEIINDFNTITSGSDATQAGDDERTNNTDIGGIATTSNTDVWTGTVVTKDVTEASIRRDMRHLVDDLYIANKSEHMVDKWIAGKHMFQLYEATFDDKMRYPDPSGSAESRFKQVTFGGETVRLDPDADSNVMYALDTDHWTIRCLAGNFMKQMESQKIEGTFDRITPVASVLAVGTDNRRANGKLHDSNETDSDFS